MAEEKEYMTLEEKVILSQKIESLPESEHPTIYRIIKEKDPNTLEDCENKYPSVLFHLLKPSTLRELENYLASRQVNTQSEIKENNPDLEEEKDSKSTENSKKLRGSKEGEVKKNNLNAEGKEESSKPTEYSEKLRSSRGSKSDDNGAKSESLKTRLRKSSKKN